MLPINDLMEGVNSKDKMLSKGSLMFCGTLPVIGDVRSSAKFYIELIDPILGRTIRHNYKVLTLPNEG